MRLDEVMSEGQANEPERPKKDWLDFVAPVRKNAFRASLGGVFVLAIGGISVGTWMTFTQPFWTLARGFPCHWA